MATWVTILTSLGAPAGMWTPPTTVASVHTTAPGGGSFTYSPAAQGPGTSGINFNVQNYGGASCSGYPYNGAEASTIFTNFRPRQLTTA